MTMQPIKLSRSTLIVTMAVIGFALLTIFFILDGFGAMKQWYYVHGLGPEIQRKCGFSSQWITVHGKYGDVELYCISKVVQGGAFSKAGFKEGEVLADFWWYYHGHPDFHLFYNLYNNQNKPVRIAVCSTVGFPDTREETTRNILFTCPPLK